MSINVAELVRVALHHVQSDGALDRGLISESLRAALFELELAQRDREAALDHAFERSQWR